MIALISGEKSLNGVEVCSVNWKCSRDYVLDLHSGLYYLIQTPKVLALLSLFTSIGSHYPFDILAHGASAFFLLEP